MLTMRETPKISERPAATRNSPEAVERPLTAWNTSTALVEVLKRCGDNLTRENVMKVVANMDFEIDTYIPGIRIKTTPTDFYPIEQVQMMKFTGEKWELFGPVIDGHAE